MRLGCFVFFLICCFCSSFGQALGRGIPTIQNYTKHDYAAETQNWDIAEDRRGLKYFGNNLGLLEFDGTYWRTYPLPNRSILRSIAVAPSGRIYVGGQDEVGYFEPADNGRLEFHSLLAKLPEDKRNTEDVWQTIIREDGVYFGTYRYLFRFRDEQLSMWESETKFEGLFEANDKLYVAEEGKSVQFLEDENLQSLAGTEPLVDWMVRSILPAGNDSLLIATEENGAFFWSNGQIIPFQSEIQQFLIENRVYCATQLSNGQYAIGTSHNGLLILDRSAKPLQNINKAYGLQNNSILSVQEGKDGNLWLGLENGIAFVELNSSFSYLNAHLGIEGTAYSARVHAGKLYLATNQGVYARDWVRPPNPLAQVSFQQIAGTRGANWNLQILGEELMLSRHDGTARIDDYQTTVLSDLEGSWKISRLASYPAFAIEGKYNGLCLYKRNPGTKTWRFV
ncbi:MAG: two-component regulator propeller domain-containing protein, partial [Bacteroidota bacterium]